MNKANQSAPTATGATVAYGNTATATASGGGGQGSIEWSNGNTQTSVGSKTTKARWSGNGNYNASDWSNEVTLTVRRNDGRKMIGNYEVVDLGLSNGLLFATCNVGANTETGYGNHYMYGKGSRTYNNSDDGYTGTENPLSSSHDTATQVMGNGFRMPTEAELEDLLNKTNYSWTTINGIPGVKFTSKTNSNAYVFFPKAGAYPGGDTVDPDYCSYWSSTPSPYTEEEAFFLDLDVTYEDIRDDESRTIGHSVRGVHAAV